MIRNFSKLKAKVHWGEFLACFTYYVKFLHIKEGKEYN